MLYWALLERVTATTVDPMSPTFVWQEFEISGALLLIAQLLKMAIYLNLKLAD
jgi:hypothetical protein